VVLDRGVLSLIRQRNQIGGGPATYFLPQVFPEGSPTHPAYTSGHATVAGACATILKAFFDERVDLTDPTNDVGAGFDPRRLPPALEASADGRALRKAAQQDKLTVEGELNKLASNIAIGRNGAGVHWRSDATQGMALGEAVAAILLYEQALTVRELHSFQFTTFFSCQRYEVGREELNGNANQHQIYIRQVADPLSAGGAAAAPPVDPIISVIQDI